MTTKKSKDNQVVMTHMIEYCEKILEEKLLDAEYREQVEKDLTHLKKMTKG